MRLEITCQDRLGITQDVLDILVKYNIDLKGIEIDAGGKIFLSFPNIEFSEFQHLMPEIRKLQGVEDVKTTPFMPIERERNQLTAILETLPDPVFSIDNRGRVILSNDAVVSCLEESPESINNNEITEYVKGFNFTKWLEAKIVNSTSSRVKFVEQDYLADILPVFIPDANQSQILAGAVIILKSEIRLGQQFSTFHQSVDDSFNHIQANSSAMKKVIREAKKMAESEGAMLFFGESGVGKELLAKACHKASRRAESEFVTINCSTTSEQVIETSLFGDLTMTGTDHQIGLLDKAKGGTLFLKEIAELPLSIQKKLLSLLQSGKFRRTGDVSDTEADVRLMCSTQYDLGQRILDGLFLEELYYRVNVLSIVVPPVRERKQDIIGLAESFIKQQATKLGRRPPKLSKSCVEFLLSYPWPGNVRQMENALYRAISLLEGRELNKEHIQLPSSSATVSYVSEDFDGTLDQEVKRFEKDLLRRLYPSYPSTRQLAKKLGLSHTAIANKLREYGINRKTVKI